MLRSRISPRSAALVPAALLVLAVAAAVLFSPSPAAARPDGTYPKLGNLDWTNDPNALLNSRYDLVALSTRATRAKFDSLHALNPNAKVLVTPAWYVYYDAAPSQYPPTNGPWSADDPNFGYDRRFWDLVNDNGWWCWGVDSTNTRWHATAFWGMWLANFSVKAPRNAQGQRLCDVYADFVIDNLVTAKGAEGVFFDQLWDSPRWLNWNMGGCQPGTNCTVQTPGTYNKCGFDLDGNFQADPPESLDVWWRQGVEIVFRRFRERMGTNFIIMGNGQHHFTDANGAMHERFPRIHGQLDPAPNPWNFRWQDGMFGESGYLSAWPTRFTAPVTNLIDAEFSGGTRWDFPMTAAHQQMFRFTFGSALLGDGYFTLNSGYYGCYYWLPEYNLRLGTPRGPAYSVTINGVTVWRRDFTGGEVWVNPRDLVLPSGATNPTVPAWDAVIREASGTVGGGPAPAPAPSAISLAGGQPNPFTAGGTSLSFTLGAGEAGRLDVVDLRGRLVRTVWQGVGTGEAQVTAWDGRSEEGWLSPTGVYFAVLEGASGRSARQKLVRIP